MESFSFFSRVIDGGLRGFESVVHTKQYVDYGSIHWWSGRVTFVGRRS